MLSALPVLATTGFRILLLAAATSKIVKPVVARTGSAESKTRVMESFGKYKESEAERKLLYLRPRHGFAASLRGFAPRYSKKSIKNIRKVFNRKLRKILEIRGRNETALPASSAASPPRFGASPLATQKINKKSTKHRQHIKKKQRRLGVGWERVPTFKS